MPPRLWTTLAALALLISTYLVVRSERRLAPGHLTRTPTVESDVRREWEPAQLEREKLKRGGYSNEDLAEQLNAETGDVQQDLAIVAQFLQECRIASGGAPWPTNADNKTLSSALRGDNPRKTVFLPESHPALNANGELCDRWGTPYRFDFAGRPRVVSAGPDNEFGTADDQPLLLP